MTQLDVADVKNRFAELIDRARSGEEIVLAEAGKPVAKMGPVSATAEPEDKAPESEPDWKRAWQQAAGIWKDREDIPELMEQLRREWNRVEPPEGLVE